MLGIFPGLNSVTKFTVITKFCKSATKIAKKKNELVLQIVQFSQRHHKKLLIKTDQ